ncbi:2-dehydropantoate 2-reductase [Saccharopolyspora cebuensis]|uniref:2-dehydropantoate 2-reductase n=1 Tax=Saccharopolyspora cebuensis TaxID=418759 RepID=A0ABV4CBR0_9PSEU
MEPQHIAVIGSGAVGGVLAAAAHEAGHRVTACVRTPFEKLALDTPEGRQEVPAEIATAPDEVAGADWVLLSTKVQDVPGTEPWLRALDDGSAPIVLVHNGVEHRRSVAAFGLRGPLLPALIYVAAERTRPGHVIRRSGARMFVEGGALGARFAALLAGSGVRIEEAEDFRTAAWRKMLVNIAANPITALTLRRLDVLDSPEVRELASGVLAEAVAVANAEGAALSWSDAEAVLDGYTKTFSADSGTSMLYDRLAGLPTEHDHITGPVVAGGREHGIPTPYNRTLLTLLRALRPAS